MGSSHEDNLNATFRRIFTPLQAANFVGISMERLIELTANGSIRQQFGPNGKRFYLGGELDVAKSCYGRKGRR